MAPGTEAKRLIWLRGEIKSPPFSLRGRIETGAPSRDLQIGECIGMPHSRPMPAIGSACHELRVWDAGRSWRIVYFIDTDAIVIPEIFAKQTRATPIHVIGGCRKRLDMYRRMRAQERSK